MRSDDIRGYDFGLTALSLLLGPREVKAEKEGFKAKVRTGISLAVGQRFSERPGVDKGRHGQLNYQLLTLDCCAYCSRPPRTGRVYT